MASWRSSLEEGKRLHAEREERNSEALKVLKQNPLLPGPWMTPAARRDWATQLCIANGTADALRCFGVRDALRFRAASTICQAALDVDGVWRAVVLLATTGEIFATPRLRQPSLEDWVIAHEMLMQFCLRDASSCELRLELDGVDDSLQDEFKSHIGLRFGAVQISKLGAVACLHLGLSAGSDSVASVGIAADNLDWSLAPTDFRNQLLKSSVLRVVLRCREHSIVLADVFRGEDWERWPEGQIETVGSRLSCHSDAEGACCEFALHLESQIPAVLFAQVLFPRQYYSCQYNLSQGLRPLPDAKCEDWSPVWLVGELWYTCASASYARDFEEVDNDWERRRYKKLASTFQVKIVEPPARRSCREVPEVDLFYQRPKLTNEMREELSFLRSDVSVDLAELDLTDRPDRLSLWLLDASGRTRFHLHGLPLLWIKEPNGLVPARLSRDASKRSLAYELPIFVCSVDFEAGRLSLIFLLVDELEDYR